MSVSCLPLPGPAQPVKSLITKNPYFTTVVPIPEGRAGILIFLLLILEHLNDLVVSGASVRSSQSQNAVLSILLILWTQLVDMGCLRVAI